MGWAVLGIVVILAIVTLGLLFMERMDQLDEEDR